MKTTETIQANVTFLGDREGGRNTPLSLSSPESYRPHLVVGDPNQRMAIVREDNANTEQYLGVCFLSGPQLVTPGTQFNATIGLLYYPDVAYSSLVEGATFTIREGGRIVGCGTVTRGRQNAKTTSGNTA